MDLGDHRRYSEGRLDAVALQGAAELAQAAMHAEIGVGRGEVLRLDAFGAARRREVDDDTDAAALAVRPTHVGVQQRALVADRVALFPGHGDLPNAPDGWRAHGAPPAHRSGTTRRAGLSSAQSAGRAWRCAAPVPTRRDACI